jgi:hypothetical protein
MVLDIPENLQQLLQRQLGIVIKIPFLVVFFFALGMSLFSDKHYQ